MSDDTEVPFLGSWDAFLDQTRPCPSCPDGNVWFANGPTGAVCPTCNGHAFVFMDGSAAPPWKAKAKA